MVSWTPIFTIQFTNKSNSVEYHVNIPGHHVISKAKHLEVLLLAFSLYNLSRHWRHSRYTRRPGHKVHLVSWRSVGVANVLISDRRELHLAAPSALHCWQQLQQWQWHWHCWRLPAAAVAAAFSARAIGRWYSACILETTCTVRS